MVPLLEPFDMQIDFLLLFLKIWYAVPDGSVESGCGKHHRRVPDQVNSYQQKAKMQRSHRGHESDLLILYVFAYSMHKKTRICKKLDREGTPQSTVFLCSKTTCAFRQTANENLSVLGVLFFYYYINFRDITRDGSDFFLHLLGVSSDLYTVSIFTNYNSQQLTLSDVIYKEQCQVSC